MKKSSKVKAKAVRKSPTKKSDSSKDSLAFELNSIRQSLESLRSALGINPTQQPHIGTGQPSLGVFITRSNTATKPFLAQFQGALNSSVKLSNIRAAILITLIVDLQDRVEGGRGIEDPLATIATIATSLGTIGADDSEGDIESAERVRVAVYRFWDFCQSTDYLRSSVLKLDFDDKLIRFIARKPGSGQALENLKIDVTSDDQALSSIISSALTRSPIEELKRRKALFVPAGADAADRLLLEMYDHSYPLTVTSLYVRPPLPSYPDQLLQKIGVSERVKRRKQLAFEGYRSGRIQFFEVLNESTIWDLIRESEHGGFTMYPDSVTKEDIAAHIANLIEILRRFDNYHFYITKVVVPFVVVTYDIQSGTPAESFTVFFQASQSAAQRDLGCFALYDRAVFQSLSEHIVRWILTHPSTIRDRGEVISLLERVLSHLSNKGSLKPGERHPE